MNKICFNKRNPFIFSNKKEINSCIGHISGGKLHGLYIYKNHKNRTKLFFIIMNIGGVHAYVNAELLLGL